MMLFDKIKNNFFWIPSFIMIVDAILKFIHISLWNDLSRLGLQDKIVWLGIIELGCLVIFLLPQTLTLGFFLLSCYWGGITFSGLIHQSFNLFPICMQTLFIIAIYWKDYSNSIKLNADNLNQ